MFRLKPTILALVVLFSAFSGQAQSGMDEKSGAMNDFFGFDGLRLNNPELLYNQRFLRDSTYFYEKQDTDADFLLARKIGFDYDNQGRLLVENEFENKSGTWSKSSKRIFNYNSDGLVEYSVVKTWNATIEEFENDQRTFLFRNYLGLISEEIVELHGGIDWMLHSKREYQYNDHNKISEELSFEWLAEQMAWEPQRRKLYEYNENKELSSEVYQVWVDTLGAWVNTSLRDYEYNDENQLVNLSQSTWNKNLGQWIEQSFQALSYTSLGQIENSNSYNSLDPDGDAQASVEVTYDENGNLDLTLFKEWNSEENAWNTYEKHEHFWNEYLIGNLDYSNKNIECFYANPHTIGLPWYCNSLLKDETYTLSVFDHNGGLHHSQQFRGGDTFRLTKSLNNGLYMIVITGGLTIHTEKVIIRN
ncbi:hypothetical protein O3Q51_15020 [Cryomorphaceae bacterium 1068]|nr:hypothetical protein [Cryomorphaceae bacterium 1068]